MTAPGWYNAEGDPPGTQRYWDGVQWVGEPVYEPAAQAAATGYSPAPGGVTHGQSTFPSSLKTTTIVLSILKAIPLVFLLIAAIFIGGLSNDFDDFDDIGAFDGLFGAVIAVLVVMLLIGATLLFFQLRGAIKEKPMMLFVAALIMSIIDILGTIGAWSGWNEARNSVFSDSSDTIASPLIMSAVAGVQIWIAVKAIQANN